MLAPAQPRKLTIRDADGRPIVGARVAPRLVQTERTSYLGGTVPDAWIGTLAAATDDNGIAALAGLTRQSELRSVWIAIPGRGTHVATLP